MSRPRPGSHRSPRSPDSKARPARADRGAGGDVVEGRQAVAELLAAGRRQVVDVWVAAEAEQRSAPVIDRIIELASARRVPLRRVSGARLSAEARTEAPQGVLAHARPVPDADLDDLCRPNSAPGADGPAPASGAGAPFLLALDGVTDPQNLGALLRTAEGAGVTGVVLPRHRAVHVTAAVTKAAAGAVEHVPIAVVGGLPAALARATELGLWVIGLDAGADQSLFDLTLADQAVVVVLGAEGRGLSRLVRQRCDLMVGIPLRGRLPSLNVSAAGALALFEISRRRAPSS
ncbi:MAG TPA: 23S rRNA (guanosine(2251)-2'-O)-methyltransferase RlmB [Acidimicrobiales bacterium]|nr:23S rRNA (guanosine(2251)-2'-O)-methyltransferase RlmB [Acidimicrobiales bacterium]